MLGLQREEVEFVSYSRIVDNQLTDVLTQHWPWKGRRDPRA